MKAQPQDARAATFKPRRHQQEAIERAVSVLADGGRAQVIMACGTGKTETVRWIADGVPSNRTAVLVPSIALVKQTWERWAKKMGWRGRGFAVCSDQKVKGSDDIRVADAGLEAVTTDQAEIEAFLRSPEPGTIFCTYQSSKVLAAAVRATAPLDLVICDEAHRLAGEAGADYACVLDDETFPAARRLFVTATPKVYSAKSDDVCSMDDESIFGPACFTYTFGEAIRDGWLTDYDIIIFQVTDPSVREKMQANPAEAAVFGLAKALRRFDLRRVLSFHSLVARANAFSKRLGSAAAGLPDDERPTMPLIVDHVSGEMPMNIRDAALSKLTSRRAEHVVISNARCCGEGIDVPAIDCVAFMDPKSSHIDIVQACGRAMRPSDGKDRAAILIPVYVGQDEDPESVISSSRFKHVLNVLRALREHDPRVEAKLKSIADGRKASTERDGAGGGADGLRIVLAGLSEDILAKMRPRLMFESTVTERLVDIRTRWPDQLTARDNQYLNTCRGNAKARRKAGRPASDADDFLKEWPGWTWVGPRRAVQIRRLAEIRGRWPDQLTKVDMARLSGMRAAVNRGDASADLKQELESWPGWTWGDKTIANTLGRLADIKTRWPSSLRGDDIDFLSSRRSKRGATPEIDGFLEDFDQWQWDPLASISIVKASKSIQSIGLRWPHRITKSDRQTLGKYRGRRGLNLAVDAMLEALPGWTWDGPLVPTSAAPHSSPDAPATRQAADESETGT